MLSVFCDVVLLVGRFDSFSLRITSSESWKGGHPRSIIRDKPAKMFDKFDCSVIYHTSRLSDFATIGT